MRRVFLFLLLVAGLAVMVGPAHAQGAPAPQLVAAFYGDMPTGVTVAADGRIFVCFPRWTDKGPVTVAQLTGGSTYVAYPNAAINAFDGNDPDKHFVSVQSVVVDALNRLWILNTGNINMGPNLPGGPKLVGVDLRTNQIVKTIFFPLDVALPMTYLNDVRFDLRRGKGGVAYITDSSSMGANAIIVVDLDSGKSYRRLNDHPSTKAVPDFLPFVEGQPLLVREPGKPPMRLKIGADGIALNADGSRLFYTPLASRRLYSVSTDPLLDTRLSDVQVTATVVDHGEKAGASDGLDADAQGRLYLTDYEFRSVLRREGDGTLTPIARVEPYEWIDTLSVAADGYLYLIANQLHRQPSYQNGQDVRQRPYRLYRVKIDGTPVLLK